LINEGKTKLKGLSSTKPKGRALFPCRDGSQVSHKGIKRLDYTSSNELGAQYVQPHQKPKRPHLQEENMPVACCRTCHVELRKLKLQWQKRSFWQFGQASHWQKCIP